jgi:hypothetical protein
MFDSAGAVEGIAPDDKNEKEVRARPRRRIAHTQFRSTSVGDFGRWANLYQRASPYCQNGLQRFLRLAYVNFPFLRCLEQIVTFRSYYTEFLFACSPTPTLPKL